MGFSDDLEAETRATSICKLESVRENMSPEDRASLDAAMENQDSIPTEVLIRALKRSLNGQMVVDRKVVTKHRQKECSCFDPGGSMS